MQTVNFDVLKQDLQKGMLISIVKLKLAEAKALLLSAEEKFNNAIKFGTGQQIYDSAYENEMARTRYGNLCMLYETIKKGV